MAIILFMDLDETLDAVSDFPSFLTFARKLQEDREAGVAKELTSPSSPYGSQNGWENITIETYLDAAIRWAESSQCGVKQGIPAENTWKQFATFLYCGKIYE